MQKFVRQSHFSCKQICLLTLGFRTWMPGYFPNSGCLGIFPMPDVWVSPSARCLSIFPMLDVWVHFPMLDVRVHFPMPDVQVLFPMPDVQVHFPTPDVWVHFPMPDVRVHFPMLDVRVHFPMPDVQVHFPTPDAWVLFSVPTIREDIIRINFSCRRLLQSYRKLKSVFYVFSLCFQVVCLSTLGFSLSFHTRF